MLITDYISISIPSFWLIKVYIRDVKVFALLDILLIEFFKSVTCFVFDPIKVLFYWLFPNLAANVDEIEVVGVSLVKGVKYFSVRLPPDPLGILAS